MKVERWITNDEADAKTGSFGGMGGWFGASGGAFDAKHTWSDYLDHECGDDAGLRERAEALRASIVDGRVWEDGGWHQNEWGEESVPMFDDGTVATFSFRAWGDLLAAVWTKQLGRQFCYMDFYYGGTAKKPADFETKAAEGVRS